MNMEFKRRLPDPNEIMEMYPVTEEKFPEALKKSGRFTFMICGKGKL